LIKDRELGERTHDREQQCRHRGVIAGEGELLLHELHLHAAGGERADGGTEVVQVAGQPVHRVDHHGVAVADEGEHRRQLRPVEVLAGDMVGEGPVDLDALELPISILLQGADPDVADALTVDARLLTSKCQVEI